MRRPGEAGGVVSARGLVFCLVLGVGDKLLKPAELVRKLRPLGSQSLPTLAR